MKLKKIDPPSYWQNLKSHTFANLVEFGIGIDMDDLAAHMMRNGYDENEPVVLIENDNGQMEILDGRHRVDAAKKADVVPVFRMFQGTEYQAQQWCLKKCLRQHLSTADRAELALKFIAAGQDCKITDPTTVFQAAESCSVSEKTVYDKKKVNEKCTPSVQRAVRVGDVSVSDAAKIANAPKRDQDKALSLVKTGKVKTLAEAIDKAPKKRKPTPRAEVKDALGQIVPDHIRDAFADPGLNELIGELESVETMTTAAAWLKKAEKLCDHYGFILITKFKEHAFNALESIQLGLEALRAGVPYAVCPKCNAVDSKKDGKTCRSCRGYGHVPEHRYQELSNGII